MKPREMTSVLTTMPDPHQAFVALVQGECQAAREKHGPYGDDVVGGKVVRAKCYDHRIKSEAAIDEMDRQGYRPATHLEGRASVLANPGLYSQFRIVALLGSSVLVSGHRYIAAFTSDSGWHLLGHYWPGLEWNSGACLPFVRK